MLQSILNKWQIKCDINTILSMWNESHRHFHNLSHLDDLIAQIESYSKNNDISNELFEQLIIVALFHDIVYDSTRNDNEEKSAEFFYKCCESKDHRIDEIRDAILDTKTHKSNSKLSELFNSFDMNIIERDFDSLLEWENGIYQEYKHYGDANYKKGRLKFLSSLSSDNQNLSKLIDWVNQNY